MQDSVYRSLFFFSCVGYHEYLHVENVTKGMKRENVIMPKQKTKKAENVVIRRSSSGLGLFALGEFRKSDTIIEYIGNRLLSSEVAARQNRYLFRVNSKWDIDGSPRWNIARYANHSCRPNCEALNRRGRIFLVARRRIHAGEELCYDYGREYVDEFIRPLGCRCNTCNKKNKDLAQ
jgi:uncharacterized protein